VRKRRFVALAGAAAATAGFAVALAGVYDGMRKVMVEAGGFCASGGPYEIAQECSDEQVALLAGGIVGMLVCWGLFAGIASWAGWGGLGGSLLMWAALFGALGWNFVDLGLDPPGPDDRAWGWIVSGAVFWLLALGGLVPVLAMAAGRLRGGASEPPAPGEPLVMAAVAPTPPQPQASAPLPRRLAPPVEDQHR
jgi:hypothetical protein